MVIHLGKLTKINPIFKTTRFSFDNAKSYNDWYLMKSLEELGHLIHDL